MRALLSDAIRARYAAPARVAALLGGVAMLSSVFMSWAYLPSALDTVSIWGAPSTLQWVFGLLPLILLVLLAVPLLGENRIGLFAQALAWNSAARMAAVTGLLVVLVAIVAVSIDLGGLVSVDPGLWVAFGGAVLAVVGTVLLPDSSEPTLFLVKTPAWLQLVGIIAAVGLVLSATAYLLNFSDTDDFLFFAALVGALIATLHRFGVIGWLAIAAANNSRVLVLATFVAAFAFPFTQNGSDANMSIAAQVVIFAATALGLNIVVGLVGLLDLGYIAFLGAGAFTAAILSNAAASTVNWHPPFIVTALISGLVASVLGLIIGAPTLRVSGDYLAIVTLAFGEIFRLTMNNLDGNDGPNLTHGPGGITGIPDLGIDLRGIGIPFEFNFGQPHVIAGIAVGRFANYFWLLLILLAVIILIFTNLNHSRIGRGWVAIREDELAAEAMGVNTFTLKLFAFAGGAFLAGLAGAVKAHMDVSVTPDSFVYMESAFMLAAVVLGGMGTVGGVLIGATILKLLPEKLRFFSDYRLLLFGALLVVMMRFRPEGIVADERRQLEFHDQDEELAEEIEEELITHHAHLNPDQRVVEL